MLGGFSTNQTSMPRITPRFSSLFASVFLFCAALTGAAMADSPMVHSQQGMAISGYDPVAYFTLGRAVRGKAELKLVWKRAEWRFATAENRAMFEANPRAYAPQYGGYCAYGVAKGVLSTTRPDVWVIHDGRLYLIHSAGVRRIWSSDRSAHVALADGNWPGVLRD